MSGDRTCNACGQTERECLRGGGKCCNVCQHAIPAPSPSIPDPSDERVHLAPAPGSAMVRCCGSTPFELPHTDRMTNDPAEVTCEGDENVQVYERATGTMRSLAPSIPTLSDEREHYRISGATVYCACGRGWPCPARLAAARPTSLPEARTHPEKEHDHADGRNARRGPEAETERLQAPGPRSGQPVPDVRGPIGSGPDGLTVSQTANALRSASLPEAPEPGTRETLCLRCKAGAGRHGGAVGFICGVCLAPSAPPVAVDPEAGAPDNDEVARWADEDERWAPLIELGRLVRADCHHGANTYCNHRVREYLGLLAERGYLTTPAAASGGDGEGTGNDG